MKNETAKVYLLYDPDGTEQMEVTIPFIPETLEHSYNAEFQEQSLLGRLSPIYVYSGNSKETLSFSLKIHEDLIIEQGQFESIVDFVEALKRFSYPRADKSFPMAYFSLGEKTGRGIIEITPSWSKPFRNGHYAVVDLSFNITIEEPIAPITLSQVSETVDIGEVSYNKTFVSGLSEKDISYMKDFSVNIPYMDVSISNFMRIGNTEQDISMFTANKLNEFDRVSTRLNDIYSAFATADMSAKQLSLLTGLQKEALDVYKYDLNSLYTRDNSEAKAIRVLKEKFDKYLDYYYENINRDMTPTEREEVRNRVYMYLEQLQILAEEIIGYAAGN